jgi:hypothetical protein
MCRLGMVVMVLHVVLLLLLLLHPTIVAVITIAV